MTGPEHFLRAEQLAEEAHNHLGQDEEQATAAVWAAVAQVHATLAVAAAIEAGAGSRPRPELPAPDIGLLLPDPPASRPWPAAVDLRQNLRISSLIKSTIMTDLTLSTKNRR